MSSEKEALAPGAAGPWPILDMRERRVLGVLVEKAKTTPDTYPLSINALTTGCNQKSNREPILNLTDLEVEDTLARCQKKGLAIKITGGRVVRWKHNLYDAWHVDKVDLAVLGELLLRGPQTEGELRSRAGRMEPIDDLDALRNALRPLVERKLVVYLTPEERRGAMLTHGFHEPKELERLRSRIATEPVESPPLVVPSPASAAKDERLSELESGLNEARQEIAALRQTMAGLQEELRLLKQSLGV
ncbi:MAG TPA: YceH family protein [Gemmataceae bacterium]|nr:YceH family protein [Gemmataceae bacterium]